MALLTYSSTYSSSDSLSLVTFWDLILCQTSAYMGSSHGVLIGKRLVGNMNIESEVRSLPTFSPPPLCYVGRLVRLSSPLHF